MKTRNFMIIFWLLLWQLLAFWMDSPVLLASPFAAFFALLQLAVQGDFWIAAGFSLLKIAGGFFLGLFLGLLFAAAAAKSRLIEELLHPLMSFLKAVPLAAVAVLLLIWWGSFYLSVSVSFLVMFPNVYINTLEGIRSGDRELLQMAEVFKMPGATRFFYIYRPALRPFLYGNMKSGLGMSFKAGIAAEVLGMPSFSIGERLYLSKLYLDTAQVFALTAVVILLSLCFEKAVLGLAGIFFAWEPVCRAPALQEGAEKREALGRIVCRKLEKGYGTQKVLSDFNAEYAPGSTHYLRQPSGSGKTTLLKLFSGLEEPEGGSLEVKGRCSMVFQEDRLCGEYSAVRNVEMAVGDRKRAEEALLSLLDSRDIHKPCRELSGGMKRRVALVRALEAESDILLLDEPFTGMDEETRARAWEYIEKRRQGRTLIIATHI